MNGSKNEEIYLVHLSIHGLVRSKEIEMGANPDTGGQVGYVIELCKELGMKDKIFKTDLITRLIRDKSLSADYSQHIERISDNARIVRLPFGPSTYVAKEELWPFLDDLVENCLDYFKSVEKYPNLIHGHYADAGYVGCELSKKLGIPFVFTGHSLGRSKLRRLLKLGLSEDEADARYNILTRIKAEEISIVAASLIVTSTKQEIDEQYSQYHHFIPKDMRIVPPGVNFSRFEKENVDFNALSHVMAVLGKFLRDLGKPIILAIARPDEKKNLHTLVKAFANDNYLRHNTNLVIVAGQRDKINRLERGPKEVWRTLIDIMDDEDLYGSVAYPKTHSQDDIPVYMALAKLTRGVFVNPALTEPFGLTILEAGAAGLPVVATNDGGPKEIISKCLHGYLLDPQNTKDMAEKIKKIITCNDVWLKLSKAGMAGVKEHYSWKSHVNTYLNAILPLLQNSNDIKIKRKS